MDFDEFLSKVAEEESWTNPPSFVEVDDDRSGAVVGSKDGTDFWEVTHYGFRRSSGHWAGFRAPVHDWECEIAFSGSYRRGIQYDQAGLFICPLSPLPRVSWIKCGVEFVDNVQQASVVATREGRSDWSTVPLGESAPEVFRLRVQKRGDALFVHYGDDSVEEEGSYSGRGWRLMRLTAIPPEWGPLLVGPMLCSPNNDSISDAGDFRVCYRHFSLRSLGRPPVPRPVAATTDARHQDSGLDHKPGPTDDLEWNAPVEGEPIRGRAVGIMAGSTMVARADAASKAGLDSEQFEIAQALTGMHVSPPRPKLDDDDELLLDLLERHADGDLALSKEAVDRLRAGLAALPPKGTDV